MVVVFGNRIGLGDEETTIGTVGAYIFTKINDKITMIVINPLITVAHPIYIKFLFHL
jgi:hypothetical protein